MRVWENWFQPCTCQQVTLKTLVVTSLQIRACKTFIGMKPGLVSFSLALLFSSICAYYAWFTSSCKAYFFGKSMVLHLHEEPDSGCTTNKIEKRRKKPRTWQDLNPPPLRHKACAQPLSSNRCPYFHFHWHHNPDRSQSSTVWFHESSPLCQTFHPFLLPHLPFKQQRVATMIRLALSFLHPLLGFPRKSLDEE